MRDNISIRIKAALLLLVFSANTLIGFACAVGVDMKFNDSHHHDEEATQPAIHIHADGKKHVHNGKGHRHSTGTSKKEKDDCCSDEVVKLSAADKAITHGITMGPVFVALLIPSYFTIDILYPSQVFVSNRYFVRSYHPPIQDIRIAIQSFQI